MGRRCGQLVMGEVLFTKVCVLRAAIREFGDDLSAHAICAVYLDSAVIG